MKKILFVAVLAFASVMAYAQPRAIGGRLGAFNGVSYEHGFGDSNMLEIEAGFGFAGRTTRWVDGRPYRSYGHNIQAAVTYDWIDPFGAKFPEMPKGEWHWYMGVGGAGGFNFGDNNRGYNSWWYAGVAGHIGIEYDFWFPFQLSLDWRPSIGVGTDTGKMNFCVPGLWGGIQLGVRYKF